MSELWALPVTSTRGMRLLEGPQHPVGSGHWFLFSHLHEELGLAGIEIVLFVGSCVSVKLPAEDKVDGGLGPVIPS